MNRLLKLRPPAWDAVKKNYAAHIKTQTGIVWAVIFCVTALGMAAALLLPYNEIVYFFGNYGLGCFFPLLCVLLIRRWNRTLAFPAALIFSAIAFIAMFFNNEGFFDGFLITLFVIVTLMIGAASDRLSFIYKWKTPLNYIGLVAVAFGLFFLVQWAITIIMVGIFLIIALIAFFLLMVSSMFGYRRYNRYGSSYYHNRNGWW